VDARDSPDGQNKQIPLHPASRTDLQVQESTCAQKRISPILSI
jgi:hypothetical protein